MDTVIADIEHDDDALNAINALVEDAEAIGQAEEAVVSEPLAAEMDTSLADGEDAENDAEMPLEEVDAVSSVGEEAKSLGLVEAVGRRDDAFAFVKIDLDRGWVHATAGTPLTNSRKLFEETKTDQIKSALSTWDWLEKEGAVDEHGVLVKDVDFVSPSQASLLIFGATSVKWYTKDENEVRATTSSRIFQWTGCKARMAD